MNTAHRQQSRAKRYNADPMSMFKVMNKIQPFRADELTQLSLPVRVAFDCLRTGEGKEVHFHTLAAAINVALIRSETIDQLCVETCQRAQDALMSILARSKRLGKWGLDAAGLQDIPPAIDLHEQLLKLSTPLQLQKAMNEAIQRMRAGQALELK